MEQQVSGGFVATFRRAYLNRLHPRHCSLDRIRVEDVPRHDRVMVSRLEDGSHRSTIHVETVCNSCGLELEGVGEGVNGGFAFGGDISPGFSNCVSFWDSAGCSVWRVWFCVHGWECNARIWK